MVERCDGGGGGGGDSYSFSPSLAVSFLGLLDGCILDDVLSAPTTSWIIHVFITQLFTVDSSPDSGVGSFMSTDTICKLAFFFSSFFGV